MRQFWAGIASLLLAIPLNQLSNILDMAWGIWTAVVAATIGYGLLVTSQPIRRYIWGNLGARHSVIVVLLTGLVTGLAGAATAWLLIKQATQRRGTAGEAQVIVLPPSRNYEFRWVPLDNLQPVLRPESRPGDSAPRHPGTDVWPKEP